MCRSFTSQESAFFGNVTLVTVPCFLIEYPDKYGISDFLWNIHTIKVCCDTALYIPMCVLCEDVFSLTIFRILCKQPDSLGSEVTYLKIVVGRCRCLKNIFTDRLVFSDQTYVPSMIYSSCGPSVKAPIYRYKQG